VRRVSKGDPKERAGRNSWEDKGERKKGESLGLALEFASLPPLGNTKTANPTKPHFLQKGLLYEEG